MSTSTFSRPETSGADEIEDGEAAIRAADRPFGEGAYVVVPGDCLESIAVTHGLFWETIWLDPANADLKRIRKDPNLIRPGDRLTIREIQTKQVSAETENRHRFLRKGVPSRIEVRFEDDEGEPITHAACTVNVDGRLFDLETDEEGFVKVPIPPNARTATIRMIETGAVWELALGHVDPIDTVKGLQARLENLDFDLEKEDGEIGEGTRAAIAAFQREYGLEETGRADQVTRDKLVEVHGS